MESQFLEKLQLAELVSVLQARGFRVIGPVVRDGAMMFDEIRSAADLPLARRDEQSPGKYRLEAGDDGEVFGVVNGPGSLKPWFFAPTEPLLAIQRRGKGFAAEEVLPQPAKLAFLGVRACDLAAVAVQDRIFLNDRYQDAHYAARRSGTLMIAVDCGRPASTCFCTSMGTGPKATQGYDLALTELADGFVVRVGTDAGAEILHALQLRRADEAEQAQAQAAVDACAAAMQRRLDTDNLKQVLYAAAEHPRWDDVAQRCLSCGNCTMVCPTCFCHSVVDVTEISGEASQRVRQWDSCFSPEHAQIHGKNFRPHVRERYRQWLTHKLAGWIDQYGTSGCVGCGRCITWCPTAIDLTVEVAAIRADADGGGAT